MKTVAFLLHAASPEQLTGGEKSLVDLAVGISRLNWRCLVVAPNTGISTDRARQAGLEVIPCPSRMLWLSHPMGMNRLVSMAKIIAFVAGWPAVFRLRKILRTRRVDVVHVNGIVHVWGGVAARSLGLPVVWHIREIVGGPVRRRLLVGLVERLADRVVVVSRAVAAQFPGRRAPVRVIYNGIADPPGSARKSGSRRPGPVRVGHAGQIQPQKGQRELIEVARRLKDSGSPRLRFLIAGALDGNREGERLLADLENTGLQDMVEMTGFLADLRQFFRSLDLLAVTSTAPDPLPRVLAEAMMEGLPVVAFATGGIPEMVQPGETGILVPAGDLDRFAAAVRELAGSPELRQRMGVAARSRALELFSMEAYIRHCVDVYAGLEGPTPIRREAFS